MMSDFSTYTDVHPNFMVLLLSLGPTLLCTSFVPSITVNSSCAEWEVRLAGGDTEMEGRVEVCYNQVWWAVSGYRWDFRDATVVCRHLHYPSNCKH